MKSYTQAFKFIIGIAGASLLVMTFQNCSGYQEPNRSTGSSSALSSSSTGALSVKNDEWAVVQPLFQQRCLSCHGPTGQKPMELFKADALANNAKLVNRKAPATSLLYTMLQAGTMPKNGTAFTADELNSVLAWLQTATPQWAEVAPILNARCLSCHSSTSTKPIDLFHPGAIAANPNLVNKQNLENSLLYLRVVSGEMPKNGAPLSDKETFAILRWIYSVR